MGKVDIGELHIFSGGVVGVKLDFVLLSGYGHCTIVSIRGTGLKDYCKYIKLFTSYAIYIKYFQLINRSPKLILVIKSFKS